VWGYWYRLRLLFLQDIASTLCFISEVYNSSKEESEAYLHRDGWSNKWRPSTVPKGTISCVLKAFRMSECEDLIIGVEAGGRSKKQGLQRRK